MKREKHEGEKVVQKDERGKNPVREEKRSKGNRSAVEMRTEGW